MKCTYFEYKELTDRLFYGIPLTDEHMNMATERILNYLLDGGGGTTCQWLGIGIKVVEREAVLIPRELIKKRFIWLTGERKGNELTVREIENIGMFLKYGAFYNKTGIS